MTNRTRRQAEYKQMALETAIRNPERYFSILKVLLQYEGVTLNDENLLTIVTEFYKQGLVESSDVNLADNDEAIRSQVKRVNSSRNADGGFPKGYAARFWTYMRTPSEFGFVYARYNRDLKVSELVKNVIKGELDEQEAFAIQSFRGNRKSPYRNVSNDYNFFKFIFELLKRRQLAGHSLSIEQFTLTMFSRDGNVDDMLSEIDENKFTGPEDVYEYLQSAYDVNTKIKTVTRDYPDVVIRMLLITGMISIKYTGIKLIGLNQNKIEFFNKLSAETTEVSDTAKENDLEFYKEMNQGLGSLSELAIDERDTDVIEGSEYTSKLLTLIEQYSMSKELVLSELKNLSSGRTVLFKEMSPPLKLEFYISLLVALSYGEELEIRPNYKTDHEGKPYSHAPGGGGDIDIFNDGLYWLIEVTLIQNRQQQLNSETTTVFRHMRTNEEFSNRDEKYLSFIAPYVHEDTQNYFEFETFRNRSDKIKFGSYDIDRFIEATMSKSNFVDMASQTQEILAKFN